MAIIPLHDVLCKVLEAPFPDGEDHCYFQPPANIQLKYPCIIYKHAGDNDTFADNILYRSFKRYTVTIIDEDPDSKIPDKFKNAFNYVGSDGNFDTEGLSHFVYTLYYNGPRIKEVNNNET